MSAIRGSWRCARCSAGPSPVCWGRTLNKVTDGGTREAIRAGRVPSILSDEDWAEVENLGVLDVLFVPTSGTKLITAVVVLSNGRDQVHCWPLAERPSFEEARGAVSSCRAWPNYAGGRARGTPGLTRARGRSATDRL